MFLVEYIVIIYVFSIRYSQYIHIVLYIIYIFDWRLSLYMSKYRLSINFVYNNNNISYTITCIIL